jgi:predicted alpha/beta hydrolase
VKLQESLFVPINSIDGMSHQIHLKHLWQKDNGPVVVMFHGVIENGRIFYKGIDKGLANFLVDHGFNVYVVDFRGKGQSEPKLDANSRFGQHEIITEDIPTVINYLLEKHQSPMHVICHSYGGVLFSSALVRHNGFDNQIKSVVCFGTKRQVRAPTFDRVLRVSLVWNQLVPLVARLQGFLDAKKFGIGDDSETRQFIKDSIQWIRDKSWRDTRDNFDYYQAASTTNWPSTWHFSAKNDHSLGHTEDVQRFINECQLSDYQHTLLSRENGNLHDYDHINMLTHPLTVKDHFPRLASWLHSLN